MSAADQHVGVRMSPGLTARIDAFATRRGLTRSEAIRWLLEKVLPPLA